MPDQPREAIPPSSLTGARIWLSGSVPEESGSTPQQRADLLDFVHRFSRRVFERGGHIVYGSHPTFVPALLEEAERYQSLGGRKDCLVLVVSRFFSRDPAQAAVDEWRRIVIVEETPEVPGSLEESLDLLRKWMASRCDAVVIAGGRWWEAVAGRAGIPIEIGLGIQRGLPCFLLGRLGGAAGQFLLDHPQILNYFKNGLDYAQNQTLSVREDVGNLAEQVCSSLERLPLVRTQGAEGISFRILALDGGGLKGTFTASVLASWEQQTGLRIVDHFDLIAGTSTGGILAIGLGLGLSAQEMLDFYRQEGPIIFPVTRLRSRIRHFLKHLWRPKFSQETLLRALEKAYYKGGSQLPLKSSRCRLVIPTYHALAGASHQFRTPHHPDLTGDANTETAHVALATAAAPTFFSAAKIANMVAESSYLDGGVWANSPAMAAIVEAVCFLRIPPERIDVLSVGTTEEPFTVKSKGRSGILQWMWKGKIIDLLSNAQQESSLRLARHLVGEPHFKRVNVVTPNGSYVLDSPREIEELAALGNRAALEVEALQQIKSRFLNGVKVAPWQNSVDPSIFT